MGQEKKRGTGLSKTHFWWMLLSAFLLLLVIAFAFQCCRLNKTLQVVKREGESLQAKLDALQGGSSLPAGNVAQLQKKGLSHLEEDLATDLMGHRELIPYKGVMGGTMGFYSQKDIHVLTSRWVLASFEDGHIGGRMLLEYDVSSGGEIQWKVISAYLD